MTRHFLRDDDLDPAEQAEVLSLATKLKAEPYSARPLEGPQAVAVIFDKPTLRTQASFTAGIAALGGFPMVVDGNLAQIGKRESVADTARVLGRQTSMVVWRTYEQSWLEEMAEHAGVPVVNALTDDFHPCQLLADLLTVIEHKGGTTGLTATVLGEPPDQLPASESHEQHGSAEDIGADEEVGGARQARRGPHGPLCPAAPGERPGAGLPAREPDPPSDISPARAKRGEHQWDPDN